MNQTIHLEKKIEELNKRLVLQQSNLIIAQQKRAGHYKKLEYQLAENKKLQGKIQELKKKLETKNKEFLISLMEEKYPKSIPNFTELLTKYNEEILSNLQLRQEVERLKKDCRSVELAKQDIEDKFQNLQLRFDALLKEALIAQEKRAGHYKKLEQQLEKNAKLDTRIKNLEIKLEKKQNSLTWFLGEAVLKCRTIKGLLMLPLNIIKANQSYKRYLEQTKKTVSLSAPVNTARQKKESEEVLVKSEITSNPSQHEDISILGWPKPTKDKPITIMSISDEFTTSNLKSVANLITPRPDNCTSLLHRDNPDFLFVESAWNGNQNSWQYRVGQYANPPGKELFHLVDECKKQSLPTVFWNKEDPVHFDKFKNAAKHFDYIFTSDEGSVSEYNKISAAKVFTLPFAADVQLNNPINSKDRLDRVCFAGSYYANRFIERRNDQLMLLESALPFGLDIYDRNANNANKDFHFPEQFQASIKGSLPYQEICKLYKQYKVFLNVNSVIDSKTMFSRRVFELMASGTPIVSTPSKGIEEFFGKDLVWLVHSREEANEAISTLLTDAYEWKRRSIQGIRKIFLEHTFTDRFNYVLETIGIKTRNEPKVKILAIIEAYSPEDIRNMETILNTQVTHNKFDIVPLVSLKNKKLKTDLPSVMEEKRSLYQIIADHLQRNKDIDFVCIFSSQNIYGKNYLLDMYLTTHYAMADIVAKPTEDQYCYSNTFDKNSALIRSTIFSDVAFREAFCSPTPQCQQSIYPVFLTEPSNFAKKRDNPLITQKYLEI